MTGRRSHAGVMVALAVVAFALAVTIRRFDARHGAPPPAAEEGPVSQENRILVLLSADVASESLSRLQAAYRVTSVLRPRIAVLSGDESIRAAVAREPGVAGAYTGTVPADVLASLPEDERLFADAWRLQQATRDKQRPGEGLSWDAPGFQPPDRPPRRRP